MFTVLNKKAWRGDPWFWDQVAQKWLVFTKFRTNLLEMKWSNLHYITVMTSQNPTRCLHSPKTWILFPFFFQCEVCLMVRKMFLLHHTENVCCIPRGVVWKEFRMLQDIKSAKDTVSRYLPTKCGHNYTPSILWYIWTRDSGTTWSGLLIAYRNQCSMTCNCLEKMGFQLYDWVK